MKRDFNPNYFRFPKVIPQIIVLSALTLLFLSLYMPDSNLLWLYGPLGSLGKYLHYNNPGVLTFFGWLAIVLHTLEALYAGYLCSSRGFNIGATMKWSIQTFIFGVASLSLLLPYKPKIDKTA